MNIGLIGYGYWGPNLLRNFSRFNSCNVSIVCDLRRERLNGLDKVYPGITLTSDANDVFRNEKIDAVIISSPVHTHYALAKEALQKGKHVLIEKPMTSSSVHAKELIDLSLKMNKVLMVDHTFLYTGAVEKIKELSVNGVLGKIKYIDSTRVNLGLFQHDVNVLWDLAPHDISIVNHLIGENPYSVQAVGISHTQNGIENIAYLNLNYNSDIIAHFHCSWTSPVKIRQMLIGGDKKMIVFNDNEPTEKVKVYDSGYIINSEDDKNMIIADYRIGDIYVPKVDSKEALAGMALDFLEAINKGTIPLSSCESGLMVVSILEAAQKSIKNKGMEIVI